MEQHASRIDEKIIRAKAHELWVKRGSPAGSAEEDWYQAERLLRAALQTQPVATKQSFSASADSDDEDRPTRKGR